MQVVDMFGSGIPVCAARYKCISELVLDGQNGFIFSTHKELAACWARMLAGFPSQSTECFRLKQQLAGTIGSWNDNWQRVVLPMLDVH